MPSHWKTKRTQLAQRLCDGLAGHFQMVNATGLLAMAGENAAQFALCQILQAQQNYRVQVSAQPPNWTGGKRVDASLSAKSRNARGWYGVAEVKWIKIGTTVDTSRVKIIQDIARVASVKTQLLNAKFVVVGFLHDTEKGFFEKPHPQSEGAEARRELATRILPRQPFQEARHAFDDLSECFPTWQDDVPDRAKFKRGVTVELLARRAIHEGANEVGTVYCWQAGQQRGRPKK